MKIWVIGRAYPKPENNMTGSFEFEQAEMLVKRGYEVYYPVLDTRSIIRRRKLGLIEEVRHGVHVVELSIPFERKLIYGKVREYMLSNLIPVNFYRRMVKKYGLPDIVHIHYPALWPFVQFSELQKAGAKIVGTEHWTKVQEKTLPKLNLDYLKDHIKHSDAFICVGSPLRKSALQLTNSNRRIDVVPNVVPDMFSFDSAAANTGVPFRFVAAGRLVACKRFDLLIEAFTEAFNGNPNVALDIIGDGEEKDTLAKKISELRCGTQVHLLGVMKREQIAEYFKKCNALVLSSNLETFGVPVIEAFASGMPVITTDAIGFLEYMKENNSIVIKPDLKQPLVEAMQKLYRDYLNYNRQEIADFAKQNFGEDAVCRRIVEIYNSLN